MRRKGACKGTENLGQNGETGQNLRRATCFLPVISRDDRMKNLLTSVGLKS